jgi:glycosyltransferase involved in cell wall biosynthesis
LKRAYQFYVMALSKSFRLQAYPTLQDFLSSRMRHEAAIVFSPELGSPLLADRHEPLLYPVWGGAIHDFHNLRELVPRLRDNERLLMTCESDQSILQWIDPTRTAQFEMLRYPIDTSCFFKMPTSQAKMSLGLHPEQRVVGFVAKLIPEKNLHVFLDLLAQLRSAPESKDVIGVIVGDFWKDYPGLNDGNYREFILSRLEKLELSGHVKLLPSSLELSQLNIVYNAMDVLVHPTMCVDENFGYVPLEALACGTPVVATAYGGLKDSVEDSGGSLLEPTWLSLSGIRADWASMLNKVKLVLADGELSRKMRREGPRYVRKHLATAAACRTLEAIVLRAIRHRPSDVSGNARPWVPTVVTDRRVTHKFEKWNSVAVPVGAYVSSDLPIVTPRSLLRTVADLVIGARGAIRINDPVWSASIKVSKKQRDVLSFIGKDGMAASRLLRRGSSLSELQELVRLGVLTCAPV